MEFKEFAERAEVIEPITGNLKITDEVAEMLRDADEDLGVASRFIQGRIFPSWDERKVSIGPSLLYDALSLASDRSSDEIEDLVTEEGDAGRAAESLDFGGQQTLFEEELTLGYVYESLEDLAEMSGKGSQKTKVRTLADLFMKCSPVEAKYLARILLGEMRVGVGEGTVRDAIVEAFGVSKDRVQRGIMVTNDVGEVAEMARDEGDEGLDELEIVVGRPVKPMLAQTGKIETVVEELGDEEGEVGIEWKFDGARCVSPYTPIYTRKRGITAIRDIEIGDEVLTHEGRFREVVAKNKREIDKGERVFNFSTYLGNDFKITEGHEVLVHRGNQTAWIPVEEVSCDAELIFPLPDPEVTDERPSETLELSTVGNYTKEFEITEDFFRFLGYWVGDGSSNTYNGNQRISIVVNNEDDEIRSRYRDIIVNELGISRDRIGEYDHGGATSVYWTDRPFLNWLSKNFRKQDQDGWRDKRVPEWFWNLSESEFDAFIKGWMDADGHEDDSGRRHIVTKERHLATLVQMIGLRLGRIFGIRRLRKNGKTYYRLILTKSDKFARIENGKLIVKILKKEELSRKQPREVDPRQKVYNLQVQGDKSYCTTIGTLHNCQIHRSEENITLYTRNLEDVTNSLPDVVDIIDDELGDEDVILDAEVVAMEDGEPMAFQEVLKRLRRKYDIDEMQEEIELKIRVFDILYRDGELIDLPLRERYEQLAEVVPENGADHWFASTTERIREIESEALEAGQEGLMAKNLDSVYSPGKRGKNWLKIKPEPETLDLVVTGGEWGEGRRANLIGSYLLATRDGDELKTIGKVATGLTDEQLEELTKRFEPLIESEDGKEINFKPEVVFEVGYEEIQESPKYSSGYALRFPRFLGVREDKDVEDADNVERVERIYDQY